MGLAIAFVIAQWRISRGDAVARTVLRWMGLTSLLGIGIGMSVMVLPRSAGGPAGPATALA